MPPVKTAKQAVSRARPKTTKPTGVVPHTGRKPKTKSDKPNKRTVPNDMDKLSAKSDPIKFPIDTGAEDTAAKNKASQAKLGGPKTRYKKSKRTPYK
jgi:hypothetical protein